MIATTLEAIGLAMVVAGVAVTLGLGAALVVGGLALLAIGLVRA